MPQYAPMTAPRAALIDGKAIAREVRALVRAAVDRRVAAGGRPPGLGRRVRPQQLAHEPLLRRLPEPVHAPQVGQGDAVPGKQAAMDDKDAPAQDVGEG